MTSYVSTCGGTAPVSFEEAIVNGKPSDGGLYVPTTIPKISIGELKRWKSLDFNHLAFEILSKFIDDSDVNHGDLKLLIDNSFNTFSYKDVIPSFQLMKKEKIYIQELFHGPSLSFKDVAMGFMVNLFDYFLQKRNKRSTLVVATTGDTGPAAASASIGKASIDTWVFYPQEMITEEQRRQMTTIDSENVHAVGVRNCPDGADDLDILIKEMFEDIEFRDKLNISSVNSINWGRVMMQTVHYFYGYLKIVDQVGENVVMSVPSGAFGNLCAGSIARIMGLPVKYFIIANNRNACLHRIFSTGVFEKRAIYNCPSSAIDILIPYNFWRYLYFITDNNSAYVKSMMKKFEEEGKITFDMDTFHKFSKGYLSTSISDDQTLHTIKDVYDNYNYVLDPHGAVAVTAALQLKEEHSIQEKILCLATAHPSKFPEALSRVIPNSEHYSHHSINEAKKKKENALIFNYPTMRADIRNKMLSTIETTHR